jgi:hypothetical protein
MRLLRPFAADRVVAASCPARGDARPTELFTFVSIIIQSDALFQLRLFLTRRINGPGNQVITKVRKLK